MEVPGAPRPQSKPSSNGVSGWPRSWGPLIWLVAGMVLLLYVFTTQQRPEEHIELSRFLELIDRERVVEATVSEGSVSGTYRTSADNEARFSTTLPPNYRVNDLVRRLQMSGAEVDATRPNPLFDLMLVWGLPLLLVIGAFLLIRRTFQRRLGGEGGPFGLGRSKARLYDRQDMRTTFEDVAGVEEVETELVELVEYLKTPEKFRRLGAQIPKGVLLIGPPGTGKTLLARAVAGEADVPFFYLSASEFIEMLAGAGAARVRDLFRRARDRAPAIVFIDEIDAIGQTRSGPGGPEFGAHQEREQTLQQLLSEMDGFEPNSGVIIMAASNRPEVLDQALLRPGRFDRQIQVNLPDLRGRREILEVHASDVRLSDAVDLDVVARGTPGFSGAQLANVINEGALLAGRKKKDEIGMSDLEEAIDRVVAGLERRTQIISEEERRMIAYHELGHAVVAHYVERADPVHRVSIVPRGIGALGYTQQLPEEDRYLISEPELHDRVAVLLGGRSAEEVVFGFVTTGAQDDLMTASGIARQMITRFGMSDKLGPVSVAEEDSMFLSRKLRQTQALSEETETAIDRELRALLSNAHDRARFIITEHRNELDRLAEILLEEETIGRRDLDTVLEDGTSLRKTHS